MIWAQGITLEVERDQAGSRAVVKLTGCIDFSSAELVKDNLLALIQEGHATIELDLSAVTHLDSTGISTLLKGWTEMHNQGRTQIIKLASPRVRRVLGAVRLSFLIEAES